MFLKSLMIDNYISHNQYLQFPIPTQYHAWVSLGKQDMLTLPEHLILLFCEFALSNLLFKVFFSCMFRLCWSRLIFFGVAVLLTS